MRNFYDIMSMHLKKRVRTQLIGVSLITLISAPGCRVGGSLVPDSIQRITASPTPEAISDSDAGTSTTDTTTADTATEPSATSSSLPLTLPSNLPAATDVISGASFLDADGNWQTGSLADFGTLVISSVSEAHLLGRVSSISVNANAVVASAMGAHTDFPTASQVVAGKYFLTDNATPVVGTLTNHGAVTIASTSASYGPGYVSSVAVNANSVIASAQGSNTTFPTASQVLTGKYVLTNNATPILGTMTDHGAVTIASTSASYGPGYVSSVAVNANSVIASAQGSNTTFPTAAQVLTGKYVLGNTATPILGTMTDHGAVTIASTSASYGPGYVSSITTNANSVIASAQGSNTTFPTAAQVLTGKYVLGNTATPILGTMTDHGAVTIASTSASYGPGYVSSITTNANSIIASAQGSNTDFPTAAQVVTGKYVLGNTATPILGTMADHGAVSVTSATASYTSGHVSSISVNANAVVSSAMGAHTDFPTASQVLTGKYYLTDNATPILGTMTNHGALTIASTSASYGPGYVSSISTNANSIIASAQGSNTDFPTAAQVLTGKYVLGNTATPILGTMTDHGAVTIASTSASYGAGYVSSIATNANSIIASAQGSNTDFPTASQVLTGKYFLTNNATPILGTMTNHGAVTINSTTNSYAAGYVSSIAVDADAVVAAAMGLNTDFPTAAQVLSGKYYLTTTGTPIVGTMTNHGAVSITSTASYGAGYVSSIAINAGADLLSENIVSTKTIMNIAGSATRVGNVGTGSEATASSVCSGRYLASATGAAVNGIRYCPQLTLSYTTGLTVWLKADDLNGNGDGNTGFSIGSEVGTWKDSSGSGNHFTQATATQLPTYRRAPGNMEVVRFDGTNDYLSRTLTHISEVFPNVDSVDIFAVIMQKASQADNPLLYGLFTTSANAVQVWATSTDKFYINFGNATAGQGVWNPAQTTDWDNTYHLIEIYRNGTAANTTEIKVDGAQITGSPSTLTDPLDNTTAAGTLYLGTRQPTPCYLKGDIAELMIYGSAITNSTNRTTVQCYLSNKYGFGISGC